MNKKRRVRGIICVVLLILWFIFCFMCVPAIQESKRQQLYEQRREIIVEQRRKDNQPYNQEIPFNHNSVIGEDY